MADQSNRGEFWREAGEGLGLGLALGTIVFLSFAGITLMHCAGVPL